VCSADTIGPIAATIVFCNAAGTSRPEARPTSNSRLTGGAPDDLKVRCATHLLLERSLRAYVTTAGISWDRLLSIQPWREIQ
jgi:hypothetical protein